MPLTQSALANVDLIWTAYYFIGIFYFVRFSRRLRRGKTGLLRSDAPGFVARYRVGDQVGWLAICPVASGTGSVQMWRLLYAKRRAPLAARRHLGLLALGLVLPCAYWYLRNIWWTGNPLYPLHVSSLGFTLLPGWCTRAAMKNSAYHIPFVRLDILAGRFLVVAGVVPTLLWCGAVLGGVLAWRTRRRPPNWTAGGFAVLALIHLLLYWVIIPYNTQERFLLACLGIGLLPLAGLLKRWPSLMPVIVVAIVVHLFVIAPGSPDRVPVVPLPQHRYSGQFLGDCRPASGIAGRVGALASWLGGRSRPRRAGSGLGFLSILLSRNPSVVGSAGRPLLSPRRFCRADG